MGLIWLHEYGGVYHQTGIYTGNEYFKGDVDDCKAAFAKYGHKWKKIEKDEQLKQVDEQKNPWWKK